MLALPEDTVNQIVGYLGTRPYAEVVNLISNITNQAIIVNVQSKTDETKSDKKDKKEPKLVKKDEAAPEKKDSKNV